MWSKKTGRFWNTGLTEEECRRRNQNLRMYAMDIIFGVFFAILLYRLWDLQIVNGEKYAEDFELKITRTVREGNTRGRIYDRNGELLADNKLVYTVTMVDEESYASNRQRQLALNGMIYRVMKKLEENGESFDQALKIKIAEDGNYEYTVTGAALTRFRADIFGEADPDNMTEEQREIGPDEMVALLSGENRFALYGDKKGKYTEEEMLEYGLPDIYTKEEVLTLVGVRYMLSANAYRKYVPVVLARGVSERTVAYIMENNQSLPGIEIGQGWERVYTGGEAFSHILGYTGKISTEELERYGESGRDYTPDSMVGKAGIEQTFEEVLQGTDRELQIIVNNRGKQLGGGEVLQEMVSGRDVWLSVDRELQIAVYHVLEQTLAGIIVSNLVNGKEFDKTLATDASDIRIGLFDIYMAFVDNEVIRTEEFDRGDASDLEKEVGARLKEKRRDVLAALREELEDGESGYQNLNDEMKEYIRYIVTESSIWKEGVSEDMDALKQEQSGSSVRAFMMYAIENRWIEAGIVPSRQQYLTTEEFYILLVEHLTKWLENSHSFEKMLFKWLIREERVTGREICRLLYDQEVLNAVDEDFEALESGSLDPFLFLKRKIGNLEITPAQLALDPCSASAVVVQPGTGKVLALVSYPGYDNNRLANQMDSLYYSQLQKDRSLPLYNRATQQLTAPGSTFKPVTVIAGLTEGVILPDSSIYCDGIFDRVFPGLKCWKHAGHGNVLNAAAALQCSCNDYLCEIVYRLGAGGRKEGTETSGKTDGGGYAEDTAIAYLQKYAGMFGLTEKSGVEVTEAAPHVTDAYGIPSAIGQGTHNYATVQLARYVNTIASGGKLFDLSMAEKIAGEDGEPRAEEILLKGELDLPGSVWETVRTGMEQFAQNNTILKELKIRVAGKTGTAQESKLHPDHALFVGYAPAEAPEIAVAVRIANGYGSSNAVAVGKSIFEYYFGLEKPEEIVTGKAARAVNTSTD